MNWYNSLSQRERTLVIYGSIAVFIILFWLLGIKPLYNNHLKLNKLIQQQTTALDKMQQQSIQIKQLQQQNTQQPKSNAIQNPQQLIEYHYKHGVLKTPWRECSPKARE